MSKEMKGIAHLNSSTGPVLAETTYATAAAPVQTSNITGISTAQVEMTTPAVEEHKIPPLPSTDIAGRKRLVSAIDTESNDGSKKESSCDKKIKKKRKKSGSYKAMMKEIKGSSKSVEEERKLHQHKIQQSLGGGSFSKLYKI
jgi:hypothetical protein